MALRIREFSDAAAGKIQGFLKICLTAAFRNPWIAPVAAGRSRGWGRRNIVSFGNGFAILVCLRDSTVSSVFTLRSFP